MDDSRAFLESILPKNVPYLIKDLQDVEDGTEKPSFLATVHLKIETPEDVEDGAEKPSFVATVHLKIETPEDVERWKDEFGRLSHTSWIIKETYPSIRKYQFKKRWFCRRSSKGKLDSESDTRSQLVKINANCKSKLSVIIRKNTIGTRRNNKSVQQGFLCDLLIVWKHTHRVGDDVDSLLKLKVQPHVCEDFEKYFEMGLAASKAREHHVEMLELKPDFDESVTLADSSLNPRLRVVTNLFEKWRMKTHGGREGDTMLKVPSSQGDKYYQVNVELNYCSCPSGFTGSLCKHQFAVSQFCPDVNLFNEPRVTAAHRYFMARVALGEKAKEPTFYGVVDEAELNDEDFHFNPSPLV